MPRRDYAFVPLTRADLPLLRRWLAEPHVRAWWGEPDDAIALITQDLDAGPTDIRIVHHQGRPFACVQDYPAHHWPMPHYAGFPPGTRAVDTFLGEPDMLGRGHAAGYLRQRAEELLADGYPAVVIDPDPANARAVRAYRRAGFAGDRILPCEDGDPVIVMEFRPSRLLSFGNTPGGSGGPAAPRPRRKPSETRCSTSSTSTPPTPPTCAR